MVKDLLDKCFHRTLYKEIIALLKNRHGIKISLRTLHRCLRQVNFYRNRKQSPLLDIVTFMRHELECSRSCIAYGAMHQRCIRNGLMVSRVIVAQVMKHLDLIGVNTKRRPTLRCRLYYNQGSNWVWHLDGYGKSKPYDDSQRKCVIFILIIF